MSRVDRYLAMAEECERKALTATSPTVKELLLTSAREWRTIAAIPGLQPAHSDHEAQESSDQRRMSDDG